MNYVIWSFEHEAWWRPNKRGYTDQLNEAGRYTAEEAGMIVVDSVWLDEVAIVESIAIDKGQPMYHPYSGLFPDK